MNYVGAILILAIALTLSFTSLTVNAQQYTIASIIIDLYYDVDAGQGYVNQTIVFNWVGNPPITVNIPLLKPPSQGRYDVINCTNSQGRELPYTVNNNNTVTVLSNGSRIVKINYVIYDYFDEVSPGMFVGVFDLLDYSKAGYIQLNVIIPKEYRVVDVEPSDGVSISSIDGSTKVVFSKPQIYFMVLSILTITTTESQTQTPIQSPDFLGYAPFIILAVLVIGGLTIFLHFKRKYSVEVEALSPSVLEDDTSKKIIELLGEAGDKGLKQSELVKLTGRPKSSISRRVRRLAEEGYVEIIRAGKHNIVKLTDKGLEAYRNMKKGAS